MKSSNYHRRFLSLQPRVEAKISPHLLGITVYGTLDKFVKMFWQNNDEGYANTWIAGDIKNEIIMRFKCGRRFLKAAKTLDRCLPILMRP